MHGRITRLRDLCAKAKLDGVDKISIETVMTALSSLEQEAQKPAEERRGSENEAQRVALKAIIEEREYQNKRWGPDHDKKHTPEEWHVILSVWLGKLANETPMFQGEAYYDKAKFLKRLAQMGAIAAAAYEALVSVPEKPGTK